MNGDSPVRHRGDTWPPLSGLGAGGPTLAAVISPRKPTLHASQVRLSFNICAHIVFLFLFTGPHAPAPPPPLACPKRAQNVQRPAALRLVNLSAVRRTPITTHTLRVRRNVRFPGKIALSPGQPAAASSARISGRQAGSAFRRFAHTASPLRYGVRYPDVGGRDGGTRRPH